MKTISTCATAAVLAFGISQAQAYVIQGSDFINNQHSQEFNGNATFEARSFDSPGDVGYFMKKSQAGHTGVGVAGGRTSGELDLNEAIIGNFSSQMLFDSFTLGLLFDGPEYGDVNEVARVSIFDGSSWLMGTLTAIGSLEATWTFGGSSTSVTALSPSTDGQGAVWKVENPFGTTLGSRIALGAQQGVCGKAGGACNNQSDYTLNQISYSAVPEPSSIALLAIGMIGLGITRSRSKKA